MKIIILLWLLVHFVLDVPCGNLSESPSPFDCSEPIFCQDKSLSCGNFSPLFTFSPSFFGAFLYTQFLLSLLYTIPYTFLAKSFLIHRSATISKVGPSSLPMYWRLLFGRKGVDFSLLATFSHVFHGLTENALVLSAVSSVSAKYAYMLAENWGNERRRSIDLQHLLEMVQLVPQILTKLLLLYWVNPQSFKIH